MLDVTLATPFVPGTNLQGNVPGANWSFLLPSLELAHIVCFGVPPPSTLETLSRIGRRVTVNCGSSPRAERLAALSRRQNLSNIHPVAMDGRGPMPVADGSVDLVLIGDWRGARRRERDRALVTELQRLLKPEGGIYLEFGTPVSLLNRDVHKHLGDGFGRPHVFWLAPFRGEMRAAVPLRDQQTIGYFLRHLLDGWLVPLPLLRHRWPLLLLGRFVWRYGALVGHDSTDRVEPPRYLRSLASDAGVDITAHRWGLFAGGDYNSKKVLFFLLDPAGRAAEYIVKIARQPALNARIENQCRALRALRERGIGDRETVPQVVFSGYHAGLAIAAETVIDGVPFHRRSNDTADCPYLHAAIDWLLALATATVERAVGTPRQAGRVLWALYEQFARIYRLAPEHRDFLLDQITAIGRERGTFPAVFQHGDPGTWNVLITRRGQVAFLDWEAAEPQGMPLWDLFYFLHSFNDNAMHSRGIDERLRHFAHRLLGESPLAELFSSASERYCKQIGLSRQFVAPLLYTCWMHRALKEATRLAPADLDNGYFVNLLRLCIEQSRAPILRRFASEDDNTSTGLLPHKQWHSACGGARVAGGGMKGGSCVS